MIYMNPNQILEKINKNKIIILIILIGIIIRIISLEEFPKGLNTDEASIGYEAYSIANYKIDRNRK